MTKGTISEGPANFGSTRLRLMEIGDPRLLPTTEELALPPFPCSFSNSSGFCHIQSFLHILSPRHYSNILTDDYSSDILGLLLEIIATADHAVDFGLSLDNRFSQTNVASFHMQMQEQY